MPTHVLDGSPSLGRLYLKAALPAVPGAGFVPALRKQHPDRLPDTRLELREVSLDAGHLVRYREVCGFDGVATVPSTYLHVLAFPLHLSLMTARDFPLAVMGAVHVEATIEQVRPIGLEEPFDLNVEATDLDAHPRGRTVSIRTEATIGAEVVWRDTSVFLGRGEGAGTRTSAAQTLPDAAPHGPMQWSLPAGLGRRYAAVSGDRNPIHLYAVTARPFGFKTQIAHGMWTMARSVAALSPRLPPAYTVAVAFKKPVPLPSTVRFGARDGDAGLDFGVTSARSQLPHLVGRVTARH